jgi:hypothetical protein
MTRWTDPQDSVTGASIAIERLSIPPHQAVFAVRAIALDQNFGKKGISFLHRLIRLGFMERMG